MVTYVYNVRVVAMVGVLTENVTGIVTVTLYNR